MVWSKGRRRRIAFFTNDLSNVYQARFRASIEAAAASLDVDLVVPLGRQLGHPNAQIRIQNALYSEWLDREAVDGVVMLSAAIGSFVGKEGLARLCASLRPIPVFSIGVPLPGVPSIAIENRTGMRVAVDHLVHHHGRRRIAYVSGPPGNAEAAERLVGYEDALVAAGIEPDPELVASGDFTTSTGREAMRAIASRTRQFDGLAVANDEMAIGALELLRERGVRIADDVLVVSFDDSPKARYAVRPLTSVAQPTDSMAEHAVRAVLSMLEGEAPSELVTMDVELVLRESCGCGYLRSFNSMPPRGTRRSGELAAHLRSHREAYQERLGASDVHAAAFWRRTAAGLLDALSGEVEGRTGEFLRAVEDAAEEAARYRVGVDEIRRKLSELRAALVSAGFHGEGELDLEKLWMKVEGTLASVTTRFEGQEALRVLSRANELRHVNERLSTALGPHAVARALRGSLEALGVQNAFLAMVVERRSSGPPSVAEEQELELEPLFALRNGREVAVSSRAYPAHELFPSELLLSERRLSLVVLLLSFEDQVLGVLALDSELEPFLSEALRSQLAASLKLSSLHSRVLEETALRERLAHEQLLGEMAIAKRLQTALTPKRLDVPGLQIAASMYPADQVGGDYYDVIRVEGGCWIGFGDVTGHGLLSGLVMLMIHSIVSTLVSTRPNAAPSELVTDLNAVLFPNIRERLGQDEHATMVLFRWWEDGRATFAGAHEDIVIYRRATRRCELVPTTGLWLAVRSDIGKETRDSSVTLEPGDLFVLYTDGVVEARNSHQEHFGLDRVLRIVEDNADAPVERILSQITSAVRAWFPVQQDDVTCLVARHTGAAQNSSFAPA